MKLEAIERPRQLGPYEVFLVAEPDVMSYSDPQEPKPSSTHESRTNANGRR